MELTKLPKTPKEFETAAERAQCAQWGCLRHALRGWAGSENGERRV